ncbi:conserved hypothetical protein [Ricinus communis]|uniref:Uncharacterized protein n=1 Tax=Ricinus communis TaxID=3988 RepID=B9RTV8_RICCO|nr:conserved hypothetical protein [Ricinus communis]
MMYLGLPLVRKRLSATDCQSLVDRITARISVLVGDGRICLSLESRQKTLLTTGWEMVSFQFWFEPWVQGQALLDKLPHLNVLDADVTKKAEVRDVWHNHCKLPDPLDDATDSIWEFYKK